MIFKYSLGNLIIKENVITILENNRQTSIHSKESGGVLLGRYIKDSHDLIIDYATEPQKSDRRSIVNFFRSIKHQYYINKLHKESEGTCNYIGEWHSHPKGINSPSSIDISSWNEKLDLNPEYFPEYPLFFIIVCYDKIRIWEGSKLNFTITKLEVISDL